MHSMRAVSSVLFGDIPRAIAQETTSQITLRNFFEEIGGEASIYVILVKGYLQSSTYFGRGYCS